MGTFDLITLSKKQGWVYTVRQLHGDEITPACGVQWPHKVVSAVAVLLANTGSHYIHYWSV